MTRIILSLIFAIFITAPAAFAQQSAWIQVEAQPSLTAAQQAARRYAGRVQDVNGFSLGSGWYAVALGPYSESEAESNLVNLRAARLIPRDSYIARSSDYQAQFWPVGTNHLTQPALDTGATQTDTQTDTAASTEPQIVVEPEPADETPRQARASEALLSRDERKELQVALQWAGFYDGAIDAAFGRGTRGSMRAWQEANNFEATGVLTTKQRAELFRQYNAVLEGLDIKLVRDDGAGIEIRLPLGVVAFEKYEAPFAHYTATGDIDARILLISQAGDERTLGGLYDIMQTLEMVPETGPRALEDDSFLLIGESALFISHTQAWLKDGEVKGFSLVWPAGDEERRTRLLGLMQESFTRLEGVMDPGAGADQEQSIDLISGLEIRRPKLSRSGFFVDRAGTVVTTAEVVQGCSKITLDEDYEAEVAAVNTELGIAVLRPVEALAPIAVAAFRQSAPRLKSDVAVAGYSYGGVLGAPTLTFGELADLRGLNGETRLKRLALAALDGDAGGPVVDAGGAVLGMLLPAPSAGKQLPEGVSFAADAGAVQQVLEEAGIAAAATDGGDSIPPEILTRRAASMTVLVSCWD